MSKTALLANGHFCRGDTRHFRHFRRFPGSEEQSPLFLWVECNIRISANSRQNHLFSAGDKTTVFQNDRFDNPERSGWVAGSYPPRLIFRGFWQAMQRKNPCLLYGFPFFLPKKQRKRGIRDPRKSIQNTVRYEMVIYLNQKITRYRVFQTVFFRFLTSACDRGKPLQTDKACLKTPAFSSILVPSALVDLDQPLNMYLRL